MCPYSRFQGVMFDTTTANVSYDYQRGEPRSLGRESSKTSPISQTGDCIDCSICVQVCPTGIDIRDGLQLPCINCGLCIDACDQVMEKIRAPSGLIRFASAQELAGQPKPQGLLKRPRVMVYGVLLLFFSCFAVFTVSQRSLLLVDVLRDRGALLRETPDGRIENSYTLKLINLDAAAHDYTLSVNGLPGLEIIGRQAFSAAPGSIQPLTVTVSAPNNGKHTGTHPIHFKLVAKNDPTIWIEEKSSFILP
jgi:cytochrome c oxidase accessory protein FixG